MDEEGLNLCILRPACSRQQEPQPNQEKVLWANESIFSPLVEMSREKHQERTERVLHGGESRLVHKVVSRVVFKNFMGSWHWEYSCCSGSVESTFLQACNISYVYCLCSTLKHALV
jgi:hypothetical protein